MVWSTVRVAGIVLTSDVLVTQSGHQAYEIWNIETGLACLAFSVELKTWRLLCVFKQQRAWSKERNSSHPSPTPAPRASHHLLSCPRGQKLCWPLECESCSWGHLWWFFALYWLLFSNMTVNTLPFLPQNCFLFECVQSSPRKELAFELRSWAFPSSPHIPESLTSAEPLFWRNYLGGVAFVLLLLWPLAGSESVSNSWSFPHNVSSCCLCAFFLFFFFFLVLENEPRGA